MQSQSSHQKACVMRLGFFYYYFCQLNIFVVLLLKTRMHDVSGPEAMKIFLDHMHATTCSHLISSSLTPGSKHLSSQKDGLLSHFPSKCTPGGKEVRKKGLCLADDRLEHYTHLGDEGLGCSCLGEDTYLTWL